MYEIGIIIVMLIIGYSFGSIREKAHFKSIFERESKYQDILIFNQKTSPSPATEGGGEMVQGNVVVSVDYFKMFVSGLRKLVGGRLTSYESLLDRGRREALLRMKAQARTMGANAIFNVRFETSSISKGAENSIGSVEVLAYGTAIKQMG